jgi:hypothetical protein
MGKHIQGARPMKPVRCPYCDKKLAEHLEGIAVFFCRQCQIPVTIDRRIPVLTGRK